MKAQDAFNTLKPDNWAAASLKERLAILKQVQANMMHFADELAAADGQMKNGLVGEDVYTEGLNVNGKASR